MIYFTKIPEFKAFWHLCYYIPITTGHEDDLSSRIIDLKNGDSDAISFWQQWAEHDFLYSIYDGIKFGLIIRILASDELIANQPMPLDFIGEAISKIKGATYDAETIGKHHTNEKLSSAKTKTEREQLLRDNYFLNKNEYENYKKNVLIIDDIKTSGTSMEMVKDTLRRVGFSGHIYGFAIGETERTNLNINDDIEIPIS